MEEYETETTLPTDSYSKAPLIWIPLTVQKISNFVWISEKNVFELQFNSS